MATWNTAILDPAPLTAERFVAIERSVGQVLGTERDLVVVQAEAILTLEAVARGVARPGVTCLNVITGPYGAHFGAWLAAAGATVVDLEIPFERPATAAEIGDVLAERPEISVLSIVHAEVATGTANPLAEIVAVAREHDVLTIVDAVASVGGHALPIDELDLDVCVIGPQKGLGGPAGVSAVTVSERAWATIAANAEADAAHLLRGSALSLLDWKQRWIDAGRTVIPGTPSVLEMLGLEAACARVLAEGVPAAIERHHGVAMAVRAGIRALGVALWVGGDGDASTLSTTVRVPDPIDPRQLVARAEQAYGVRLLVGAAALGGRVVRVDHMGQGAAPAAAVAGVAALGGAIRDLGGTADVGAGVAVTVERLAQLVPVGS